MAHSEQQREAAAIEASNVIRIITETRNLKIQPFTPKDDQITTGKVWDEWLEEIERELRYFKISDSADKKDALIIYGGKEIARLEKSLPDPLEDLNTCGKLKTKLNNYFTPKKNKHHARYLFLKLRPSHGETIAAYASRLREKANECKFEANSDDRILEHLIQTTHNRALIQKAINKKWNLSQFLTEASQMEDTSLQVRNMKVPECDEVKHVSKQDRYNKRRTADAGKSLQRRRQPCNYCGQTGAYIGGENCPAYWKKCRICKKDNHYAVVCRSKTDTSKGGSKKQDYGQNSKPNKPWSIKKT